MRWLLLVVLVIVAAAVFVSRSMGRPASVPPAPPPAPTIAPATPAAAPPAPAFAKPAAATPRPTPLPAAPVLTATSAPTVRPTARPAASPTVASAVTPTPTAATATRAGNVELTFDAGADRGYAEDILDVLKEEHVVASFGITGTWARSNQDLVRRMAADGHLVFNHTLNHRSFTGASDSLGGLSASARRAELEEADAIIAPLIGHSTRPFYRLPYGDDDARVANDVLPAGYTHKIGWTVDSLGWRGISSADIVARCLRLAAPGAVYVFHVGRESQDGIALAQVIRGLRAQGYTFSRVDQGH